MASPKVPGDIEECSSSESGWTMYLASPSHNNSDDDGDDHDSHTKSKDDDGNRETDDKSDGSMASDASSGPSYLRPPPLHLRSHGEQAEFKHSKDKDRRGDSSKKADKKFGNRKTKPKKETPGQKAYSAKVRKAN